MAKCESAVRQHTEYKIDSLISWAEELQMAKTEPARQVAALCYRRRKKNVEILLVKSLGRGNWMLPKGWPMEDRSHAKAAAIEAFEEAGAKGKIKKKPIGKYRYNKTRKNGDIVVCEALAYEMEVFDIKKNFPESEVRTARWFSKEEAAETVAFKQLRKLIADFNPPKL